MNHLHDEQICSSHGWWTREWIDRPVVSCHLFVDALIWCRESLGPCEKILACCTIALCTVVPKCNVVVDPIPETLSNIAMFYYLYYSGHKAPSLKMHCFFLLFCFCFFVFLFLWSCSQAFKIAQYSPYYITVLYTQNGRRLPGLFVLNKTSSRGITFTCAQFFY